MHSTIGQSVIRSAMAAAACLAAAFAVAPFPALAQHVCAKVNREAITDDDIDQRMKSYLSNGKSPARKAIIEELIDEKFNAQMADMAKRMHLSPDKLTPAILLEARRSAKIEFTQSCGTHAE
jgi:hypothetical protein